MRVLYRIVQDIPMDKWPEKIEQERLSDEAEKAAGWPLPRRYRAMFGSENSHIRVNEREFESYAELARLTEEYFDPNNPHYDRLHELEARRRQFLNWEREELYYVDSGEPVPGWMEKTAELFRKNREAGQV